MVFEISVPTFAICTPQMIMRQIEQSVYCELTVIITPPL